VTLAWRIERNEQMRVKYQRAPITTVAAAANTGDGIVAEKLGAALDVMEDAWWAQGYDGDKPRNLAKSVTVE
jgi:hypothetical protein